MASPRLSVRFAGANDADRIAAIYNHFIEKTPVTFEEAPVCGPQIEARLASVQAAGLPWLVAKDSSEVVGYAYATPWKDRRGYRFSVEVTVYVEQGHEGRGVGSALYGKLFDELERRPVRAALGGIVLPNDASVALHEKFGMEKVAHFRQVGTKFGEWIDVGYWQRLLRGPSDPAHQRGWDITDSSS